jgi:hypothetical protein
MRAPPERRVKIAPLAVQQHLSAPTTPKSIHRDISLAIPVTRVHFGECGPHRSDRTQRSRKACREADLHQDFRNLFSRNSGAKRRLDVHLNRVRAGRTERRTCGQDDNFPGL